MIKYNKIQREIRTGSLGSSLLGIADAYEKFGFHTLSARSNFFDELVIIQNFPKEVTHGTQKTG